MLEPAIGDVVCLNSGGPQMVVTNLTMVEGMVAAECAWVTTSGEGSSAIFPVVCLSLIRRREGAIG